ncbi:DUF485 domain-containing protein [Chloroflexota bacterium]
MEHGSPVDLEEDKSEKYKTTLGLKMVAFFIPVYLAFILVCVISPTFMAKDIGSLNVAIVFGFGIIILAIIQALIYNYFCSRKEKEHEASARKTEVAE